MESLPYPDNEYVSDNIDIKSGLAEELRLYPTEFEFKLCIKGLLSIHGNTPLGDIYSETASSLSHYYAKLDGSWEEEGAYHDMFHVGSILGLHLATHNLPEHVSGTIHRFGSEYSYADFRHEIGEDEAYDCISWLSDLDGDGFDHGDQAYIDQAAELYKPEASQDLIKFFSLGFRYGVISAADACEHYFPEETAA
jgi:hypothetical protein